MLKADHIRIQHMIDAGNEALSFIEGKERLDMDTDRQLALSLVRELEIIGEAASKVSKEAKALYPKVPWTQIINMRNHLIHVYFDVDLDIIWDTVKGDVPILLAGFRKE